MSDKSAILVQLDTDPLAERLRPRRCGRCRRAARFQLWRRHAAERDGARPRLHLHARAQGAEPHRDLHWRLGCDRRRNGPRRSEKAPHSPVRPQRLGDARLQRREHHRSRGRPRRWPTPRSQHGPVARARRHRAGRPARGATARQGGRARSGRFAAEGEGRGRLQGVRSTSAEREAGGGRRSSSSSDGPAALDGPRRW